MRILVTGVFFTGVLCCYAVPDGEKFNEEAKISSHHEQQLGYRHQIHDANQREHRSFQENKSPQDNRQQPENYVPTQIPSQPTKERQQTGVQDQLKQNSNQNQKQRLHNDRQDQSVHQPQQHQPQPQQPQQRKELYTRPPSPPPSPQHRQLPPPPISPHRHFHPPLPSSHRRRDRPSLSPNRNLDNAQRTKHVQTIPGNGEPLKGGESDSFDRNGSRPISAEDIFRRLPHRYEVANQHNVKTFHNNDGRSPHQDLPFKEPYLIGESAETTSDEILGIEEEEEQSTSTHQYEKPYSFEGDYHDESLSGEGSVSVFAYTESSVQSVNSSTVNYPEPLSFVETDANRFESHQPDIAPFVGYAHLRRQLEDITRQRNTSSIQIQENEDVIKEEIDFDFPNNHYVQAERRGDGELTPTSLHDDESDEYTEVFDDSPNVSGTDELSQTSGRDSGYKNETPHPIRFSEISDGELTSSSISSLDLDRRSISRPQSGRRRFQRPLENSPSPDQRARNRKPQISMRKQLARYSDTRSIVSPLFNSTFSRDELHPNNSGDFDFIELTKAEPTIKTKPSFHIKSDYVIDFTTVDDSKENPSHSIVDDIVEYSKSSEGTSDLEAGFVGPENPPGRKYSYSYVNHYIAPTPNAYRTTEKPSFESDVQTTSPRTHVGEVILVPPPGDSVHQRPNETLNDSVIGEYSDSFPTILRDSVFPIETTQIQTEPTSRISTTTTTTTTTVSTTTPENTTTTPTTTTMSAASISTEPNSISSFLVDRASGTLISTESPNLNPIFTSPLPISESYESTTPSTPAFNTSESLLNQLPPNPFLNLQGFNTNFSTTNWNQGSDVQSNLNAQNPFAYRFPQSQSFQSNAQSQSSPLGSTGSNLFGLSNLLGLGTLSGLPGFGQSTSTQPGAATLGFTSAPISHLGSSSNSNSGQQGGSSVDLGGLGYLSLLTAGLGGLNLSPQSGLDLSSFGSGGAQQSQAFNNPFQHVTSGSGSSQPDNSFVQQILKQLGGGGSLTNQNPFGYTSSLGQNPYAIHPQALSLGAVSSASLLPATFGAGSVQPVVAAPAAASSSSDSGSSSISIDSAVPEGT